MSVSRWFRFVPSDAFTGRYRPGLRYGHWFAAWQWFVRRLHDEYKPKKLYHGVPYEYINGTSSIHNHEPDGCTNLDEPKRRLRELFKCVSESYQGSDLFLRRLGIRKWSDLDKPIAINVKTCDSFPNRTWFEMCGREFKVSPNSSHKLATWVMGANLQPSADGKLWRLKVEYGYRHDSSHWFWVLEQSRKENLPDFVARVDREIEAAMKPDYAQHVRLYHERQWQHVYRALRELFYGGYSHLYANVWEQDLADRLVDVEGTSLTENRIDIDERRLATLKRWIADTKATRTKRAKREKVELQQRRSTY